MRTATAYSKTTTIISPWSKSDDMPWDTEMARRIAREYNVPYRQPNKVPVKPWSSHASATRMAATSRTPHHLWRR